MNTDNVYLVILIALGIIVLSNLVMFFSVRSYRNSKFDWFNIGNNSANKPFKYNDEALDELHQRVKGLENPDDE